MKVDRYRLELLEAEIEYARAMAAEYQAAGHEVGAVAFTWSASLLAERAALVERGEDPDRHRITLPGWFG
jgi:hypothetical protein